MAGQGPPPSQHPSARAEQGPALPSHHPSLAGGALEDPRLAGREAETPEKRDPIQSLGEVSGSGRHRSLHRPFLPVSLTSRP